MPRKRTPQTFEKRCRERDKQAKRQAKQAERLARNAAKRRAKLEQSTRPLASPNQADVMVHPDAVGEERLGPSTDQHLPGDPALERNHDSQSLDQERR